MVQKVQRVIYAVMCVLLVECAATGEAVSPKTVTIAIDPNCLQSEVVRYAASELEEACQGMTGTNVELRFGDRDEREATIELAIDTNLLDTAEKPAVPESFRIVSNTDAVAKIIGVDAQGTLWGVRDFIHYYAKDWLGAVENDKGMALDIQSSPTLQTRGLWSWGHGCYDPYAYIDRASDWKLNTIVFWNRGVPLDAERLNAYAHDRGVKIWWGFSWGWTANDFADASPKLAQRLNAIYERQKKEIGPELQNLCPYDPETPGALMDYVLDVFERQYAWIPDIDGIYFQTATESVCPCPKCKAAPRGEGFMRTILPIIKELHRRYPNLLISCGVHNTGDIETFKALKQIPDYCNICWEAGATWAPTREIALDQMTYRGANENYAGVYRITMNCGLVMRGEVVRGEPARAYLPRVDKLWAYLEEGQPEGSGHGYKQFMVGDIEVGYPCTSDWRPVEGEREIDNPNFKQLLEWSRDMAQGPAKTKGVFLLVEAGLLELKMRRVAAMAAETIWNPLADESELERRAGMIWRKEVGGWSDPINPLWSEVDGGVPVRKVEQLDDLGDMYRQLDQKSDE